MQDQIKVWDLLVRVFHWSLVSFFVIAYVTEDDFESLHVFSGYALLGLVLFRLVWAVVGTHYARFSQFIYSPMVVKQYLLGMLTNASLRYIGHNPAGGYMVLALLFSIVVTALLGMALYATEGGGPLANTWVAGWHGEWLEELHEGVANFTVLLIGGHLIGVLVSSLKHRENLVKSMWNGVKQRRKGDVL